MPLRKFLNSAGYMLLRLRLFGFGIRRWYPNYFVSSDVWSKLGSVGTFPIKLTKGSFAEDDAPVISSGRASLLFYPSIPS